MSGSAVEHTQSKKDPFLAFVQRAPRLVPPAVFCFGLFFQRLYIALPMIELKLKKSCRFLKESKHQASFMKMMTIGVGGVVGWGVQNQWNNLTYLLGYLKQSV